MIEYSLIVATISTVIAIAGPPVASAIQGQFTKVANVISNGSTGGTGGGSDFPGGGGGGTGDGTDKPDGGGNQGGSGGSGQGGDTGTEEDRDKDGIPDDKDAYPDDPLNGCGDRDGDGIMDKDDKYPDDPLNGKPAVSRLTGTVSVSDCTVGLSSTAVCSDAPSDAALKYTWFIDGAADPTTGPTHRFTKDDLDKNVYVAVTDEGGKFEGQVTSPIQRVGMREMSGTASIGALVAGKPTTAHINGAPSGADLKYTWYADGVNVCGEQTFTPDAGYVGQSVYVEVTDRGGVYSGSVTSTARVVAEDESAKPVENKLTGSLSIGDCVVGLTTTAFAADVPADAQLEYTWQIGTSSIGGATHTFTKAEGNAEVRVTCVDGSGKYEGKLYSNVVRVKTRPITGAVSFAEAVVDKDLSAILHGIPTDIAAKDLKYSWTVNGVEKGTQASYTPATDDIGGSLVLEVTDGSGKYSGSLISQSQIVRAKSAAEGGGGTGGGSQQGTPLTGEIEISNAYPGATANVVVKEVPVDAALQYRWTLDWETMSTDLTYNIPKNAEGKRLGVIATDSSGKYCDQLFASAVVEKMKITGSVAIAGSSNAGNTVSASLNGIPTDITKEIVWKINGNKAGTGESFKIPDNAFGKTVSVEVSDTSGKYAGTLIGTAKYIEVHEKAANWTPAELSHIAKDISSKKTGSKYYSDANEAMLNQTKWTAKMSDGNTMKYQIIGINHDDRADGSGKSGLTLQASDVIYYGKTNNSSYLTDGWAKSDIRTFINGEFLNKMPSDLKSAVTEVTKKYDSNSSIKTVTDKAFLPSTMEVWGSWNGKYNDGTQYELFATFGTNYSDYAKFIKNNKSGTADDWLLRDGPSSSMRFLVARDGARERTDVTSTIGLAPCFCIG